MRKMIETKLFYFNDIALCFYFSDALQHVTKLSHDQYYGPVRALENRRLQISLGKLLSYEIAL